MHVLELFKYMILLNNWITLLLQCQSNLIYPLGEVIRRWIHHYTKLERFKIGPLFHPLKSYSGLLSQYICVLIVKAPPPI